MVTVEHNEVNGEKSSAHPKFTEEIKEIAERESVDFDDASVHKPQPRASNRSVKESQKSKNKQQDVNVT